MSKRTSRSPGFGFEPLEDRLLMAGDFENVAKWAKIANFDVSAAAQEAKRLETAVIADAKEQAERLVDVPAHIGKQLASYEVEAQQPATETAQLAEWIFETWIDAKIALNGGASLEGYLYYVRRDIVEDLLQALPSQEPESPTGEPEEASPPNYQSGDAPASQDFLQTYDGNFDTFADPFVVKNESDTEDGEDAESDAVGGTKMAPVDEPSEDSGGPAANRSGSQQSDAPARDDGNPANDGDAEDADYQTPPPNDDRNPDGTRRESDGADSGNEDEEGSDESSGDDEGSEGETSDGSQASPTSRPANVDDSNGGGSGNQDYLGAGSLIEPPRDETHTCPLDTSSGGYYRGGGKVVDLKLEKGDIDPSPDDGESGESGGEPLAELSLLPGGGHTCPVDGESSALNDSYRFLNPAVVDIILAELGDVDPRVA